MDVTLAALKRAGDELAARKSRVDEALARRNELIVQAALETTISYEEIGEAVGVSVTAVWKVTTAAGISRQRVRQLPAAGA